MELPVTVISSEIKRGCILHSNDFDKIDQGKFFAIIGEDGDNVIGAFFINSKILTTVLYPNAKVISPGTALSNVGFTLLFFK